MPNKPGVPEPIKLQEQHKAFFPLDKPITEESGRILGEWAKGGTPKVETKPAIPEAKPPVHETKPGVFEPKGQVLETGRHPIAPDNKGPWTDEMTVRLCGDIEKAATIPELQLYGEQAKDKRIPSDDRDVMRGLYKIRLKALNSPQAPQGEAAGAQGLGADTAPAQAAEEKPWI